MMFPNEELGTLFHWSSICSIVGIRRYRAKTKRGLNALSKTLFLAEILRLYVYPTLYRVCKSRICFLRSLSKSSRLPSVRIVLKCLTFVVGHLAGMKCSLHRVCPANESQSRS